MKVYKIVPTANYCYGCAIVAANSKKEAIKAFKDYDEYNKYSYKDDKCECDIIDKLDYDCSKPTVIIDTVQAE